MRGICAVLPKRQPVSGRIFRIVTFTAADRIRFIHVSIPFSVFNIGLNLVPTYIAYKFIGKKFTLYSIIVIVLTSIFTDMLPAYVFTKDVLLISVFGGLINGFAISLCLNVGTTTGGTDFISIFLSRQKGIDAWNYILAGNVLMLVVAGALFGWSIAFVLDYLPVLQHADHSGTVQALPEGNDVYYF